MEKAAAHAVANAVLATIQGKDALAGAAGAAAGELAGGIALEMYGKDVTALSESEKQTISALATLAAGIAGGVAGDGTASAIDGALAGKTVVENNSLANVLAAAEANKPGTVEKWKEEQQAAIKEACSGGTPVSCEMAVAMVGTVMSGGVLPEAMLISGAITSGVVSGVDWVMTGSVDPKNAIAAYWGGVLTTYTGLKSTVLINAANGAITSSIDGKNPFLYGTISGLGGAIGYGVGNKIIAPMADDFINPTWKNLRWDDIGLGISQPSTLNPLPGIIGTGTGGSSGEIFNVHVDPNGPLSNKGEK
ncbi:VENN motif pre-toxin domain-containing protein [Enterobacter cancerogenus]|uniref:VENN motif pre-toxin domain-containing protein n=1 Tax=Enterobacter cancerogenus TaxID=69218 RepID=UPI001FCC7853|nr:VENN motif pre-toxin domain-containing protein [Enterobacter cancerogenus]